MNDPTVSRETHIHGGQWGELYGGYFADPQMARDYVAAIVRTARACRPAAMVDLGGGTGFILEQLLAAGIGDAVRLVNMDESAAQLAMCRHPRIKVMPGAIQSLRRDDIITPAERLMVVCRSVLHYGGIERQRPWLASLRAQMHAGEYFVHQSGCSDDVEGALALDVLFELMGVDKWVPHQSAFRRLLRQSPFEITEELPAPALPMPSDLLAYRYGVTAATMKQIEADLRRTCAGRPDVVEFNTAGFVFKFPYRVFVCRASG